MKIEIRDARIEDVEIVAWTVLTALDLETDDMDRFIKTCTDESTMYSWKNAIIAFVDGKAAGCLIAYEGRRYMEMRDRTWHALWDNIDLDYLKKVEQETQEGDYYLDSMAILPKYRGYNIGKLLLERGINKSKELGCETTSLIVSCQKPRLEAYYRSVGFTQFGEMEFFGHYYKKMRHQEH